MREVVTRHRLVHAAMGVFARHGYEGGGVAEICKTAGAHSGSFYNAFESKEACLAEVLATYRDGMKPLVIDAATKDVDGPLEKVFALLAIYRRALVESGFQYGCPVAALATELRTPSTAIKRLLEEVFEAWRRPVEDWLEAGRGWLAEGVTPRAGAMLALAAMQGGVVQARAARSIEPYDVAVAGLRRALTGQDEGPRGTL